MAIDAALEMLAQLSLNGKPAVGLAALPAAALPHVVGASPQTNVQDVFKLAIAQQVSELTGAKVEAIYAGIENHKSPEQADFAIAIPRLKLKGNPAQLTKELVSKVCTLSFSL